MTDKEINVVTGANGFTGSYITKRLLSMGNKVINLTGHPDKPHDFGEKVSSAAFNFDDIDKLAKSIQGATTLYNTYWIRFERGDLTFDNAVENSRTLIKAAESAGIRRIVHISITKPSEESPLPYYKGKALVENAIKESSLSYAILRPNVLFGDQGILLNNIAWFLRHLPVFGIPGDGKYKMQPIFVEDLADLAVEWGQKNENTVMDAVGPEIYTFNDLLRLLKITVNSNAIIIHMPPALALQATNAIGMIMNDVVLTPDEVTGLLDNLLVSDNPPTAPTHLSHWLADNQDWLGKRYFSELKKHYSR